MHIDDYGLLYTRSAIKLCILFISLILVKIPWYWANCTRIQHVFTAKTLATVLQLSGMEQCWILLNNFFVEPSTC